KLMVRVFPGVELTCANFWPSRELIRLDLPTFERPRKANSGGPSTGNAAAEAAEVRNLARIGFTGQLLHNYWGSHRSRIYLKAVKAPFLGWLGSRTSALRVELPAIPTWPIRIMPLPKSANTGTSMRKCSSTSL